MTEADLPEVHRVECAGQEHPWTLEQFRDELLNPAAKFDLYLCDGSLAAYLCSWLIAGELQVQNVVTSPEFRRQGIAACLLARCLERSAAEGLESAWLEVRDDNIGAIRLYERFGFKAVDRRPGYYRDGTDALIMTYQPGDVQSDHPRPGD